MKFLQTLNYFKKISVAFKALDIINMLFTAIESVVQGGPPILGDIPDIIYGFFPKSWKKSYGGPCSVQEFRDWLNDGIKMFQKDKV